MWVRVVVAFGLALGVGCAGKSRSSAGEHGDGSGGSSGDSGGGGVTGGSAGTTTGGSAGTTAGGSATGGASVDANCNDERRAMRDFINQNKSCIENVDCQTFYVGCGITEDGCAETVYVNNNLPDGQFGNHQTALFDCLETYESTECDPCDRASPPPICSSGKCIGRSDCALEAEALFHFMSRNDACEVDADCVTETVGCEVTEDDCTGAVYFAANLDRGEFTKLRDEYWACTGACPACERGITPPACVSGHCRALILR